MLLTDKLDYLAATAPQNIALVDSDKEITFKELRDKSLFIAQVIHDKYKKTNSPIVVEVNRKVETVICFFAVLYSGNFYVPINNAEPKNRILDIINKVEAKIGIFHEKNIFTDIESIDYNFIDVSELNNIFNPHHFIIDVDPCYVLFTSGSTGKPKGVVISHKMVLDLIEWIVPTIAINDNLRIANQTPFFFDASVKEIALMLGSGATIYIMDTKLFMFPIKAVEFLNNNKINCILWSVSAINIMANSKVFDEVYPRYLKIVTFAGEALSASKLNYWQKFVNARYFNLYGPTEATVDACYYEVNRKFDNSEIIPIGKACDNMDLLILDGDKLSNEGELVIRGTAVSYGYYNDLAKTEKAFVQNPLNKSYPEKVYRTGDLVRLNKYGEIEFLARKDNQIKMHGYRIELGEIELAIASLDIDDVVCIYDDLKEIIVAIYSGKEHSKAEFRKHLKNLLPTYMIPSKFIHLYNLPKTQNTKLDRVKLKEQYINGEI
ncbi:amino acid adenylation domain-containing protein [Peptoniphilus olsenii]|uniref:Amino acid adenylation domain-containing protein n=1 Tax=Peptoniphilus olsenii TaxID=411570 RepID=A0ABV2JC00_9FIRM